MTPSASAPAELTLDPENWDEMKALGHQMVEDMLEFLRTVRDRPAWQPMPESVKAALRSAPPEKPEGAETAYRHFQEQVLPYATGNIHPRFWGWVMGTGTPLGMLAEMLAAGMNSNVFGGEQSACYVEEQVVTWFRDMLDVPETGGGLLVSSCSLANLTCLTAARDAKLGADVKERGLSSMERQPVLYCSTETHNSIDKAASVMGLGRNGIRAIPVNSAYEIDTAALRHTIETDIEAGLRPFCVVASAGTVNTGALDNFTAIANIAKQHDLWMHVDGAIGTVSVMSPLLKPLFKGMERADSIAFDLHKWMYMPYGVACAMVRDTATLRASFSPVAATYLARGERGLAAGKYYYGGVGMDLSRAFTALKVWMSIKEHGLAKYRELIEQNVEHTKYLIERVNATDNLEVMAPAPLNVACIRYKSSSIDDVQADALNKEIVIELHERGIAVPSGGIVGGRYVIRVANTNQRSRREDFDLLTDAVREIGAELLSRTAH
ncbi:MAG: aminotransferase class V-fold PLP-dependent enzyme [Gemmatimonadota bacterium]|nr:aminotransferase class V-fold PLP-dependent enzyme [Gemmatimonadota bacterium]